MCEITAVTSGKGGSGKTMAASNIAAILAMNGRRVLLIDMNAGQRNLDICLGLENQIIFDLADVVNGTCPIGKALVKDERFEALYLLSAPHDSEKAKISGAQMKKLCKILSKRFEHIIIDTPDGFGEEWKAASAPAMNAVIVMTQEFVSVRCADTVDMKLRNMGIINRCVIVNKVSSEYVSTGFFPALSEISDSLRARMVGVIQEDMNIHIAMNKGVPVVCKNDTYIRTNFEKITDKIFD